MRVVFDTVVFVRALMNPHGACGQALFRHAGSYRLFVSRPIVAEIFEVLHRPELTRKLRTLEGMDWAKALELVGRAEVVEVSGQPAVSRDPRDDIFLATALAAEASYLVSEDEDLLILANHLGTRIVNSNTFLHILREAGPR